MTTKSILAWHWLPAKNTYTNGLAWAETVEHTGPLALCEKGLHASVRAIDSLKYAPGPIVCRVRCSGETVRGNDKLVCRKRTVLWQADATEALREFARLCALDVIHLWKAPKVVEDYLRTGDERLRAAARAAAWDVAKDAARAATRADAWAAAWAAARAAVRAAAGDAGAAGAAAWDAGAARDAAKNKQNERLTEMLLRLEPIAPPKEGS